MKIRSRIFYGYAIFVTVYTLLALLPAPDHTALTKYHLSPSGLRLLDITLLVPLYVMWFAIFYGYARMHRYSQLIKQGRDGKQVVRLVRGLLVLALGLPLSSIISVAFTLIARVHPGFLAAGTIISNYLGVVYLLMAFIFIIMGARGLNAFSGSRPSFALTHMVVGAVIVLGVIFCDLIARAHHSLQTTYHMSYALVMLTFAIPYMYIWYMGLSAIAEMYVYSKQVAGVLYRKGWNRLTFGLGSIIAVDIALQYLSTLVTWLNGLSLAGLLGLLYVLLLLMAVGFIVVALGTKELMKIEEA